MNTITPRELAAKHQADEHLTIIDVRTPAEFGEVHLAMAQNIPLDRLDPAMLPSTNGPLYLICRSGSRGGKACDLLRRAGRENVINVEGGTLACIDAGLPVVRGRQGMSLERQVRIAAGALVLLGVAAGYFLHPIGLGLAAFIGAGLVFAGISDTCGMGMLLARMPWNQSKSDAGNCAFPGAAS